MSFVLGVGLSLAFEVGLYFGAGVHHAWILQEDGEEGENVSEEAVIGFWSGFAWLLGMTVIIALLSEYAVQTIEEASDSWGLSISFLSIILLPIVGNAAEHAGAIIFAFKNKLDKMKVRQWIKKN